jgi:hypothetical protein
VAACHRLHRTVSPKICGFKTEREAAQHMPELLEYFLTVDPADVTDSDEGFAVFFGEKGAHPGFRLMMADEA